MTETLRQKMQAGGAFGAWWRRLPIERRRRLIVTNVAILLLLFPFIDRNGGDIDAAANATAFAVLALGLNIVVGFAGLLDLGYVAFFAVGAYMYALLASPHLTDTFPAIAAMFPNGLHTPLWLAVPLGALLAGFFGVLLGAPTLKLRGDYLAIVTLGLAKSFGCS